MRKGVRRAGVEASISYKNAYKMASREFGKRSTQPWLSTTTSLSEGG